ncbi:MAG: T9SS C-terminal target domain-containing protein, partial [Ignavibacteriales bacterium]
AGFADLDGDARKDMILGEYNGNFTYYKNLFSPITNVEVENDKTISDGFVLNQNYPNPFNPTTKIQYAISSTQFVTLKVYDVLGREVATLVNEEKPAGGYEVQFNASSLSSGVYIYTLKFNGVSYSKSMILLR